MNSATTLHVSTTGSLGTIALAQRLGRLLRGGELIELTSDLGGGKTTFVKGLASGLGYEGVVTSPTFTLGQIYRLKSGLELHHYDLYRLAETGVVGEELAENLSDPLAITVIEWAGIAAQSLPVDRLTIELSVAGVDDRAITLSAGGSHSAKLLTQLKEQTS
jgi:tRNA threonylcarbamoyladenosine biosynthesis protein TsaE